MIIKMFVIAMVKDTVYRANLNGWTACAPIQRGVGQEAKKCSTIFNCISACSDLHTIAGVVRQCCPGSLVVAGGYSMGGVTASKYPAAYADDCRLDGNRL